MDNNIGDKLLLEHVMYDITHDDTIGDVYVDNIYYKMKNVTRAFTQVNPHFGKLPKKKITTDMNLWTKVCCNSQR